MIHSFFSLYLAPCSCSCTSRPVKLTLNQVECYLEGCFLTADRMFSVCVIVCVCLCMLYEVVRRKNALKKW